MSRRLKLALGFFGVVVAGLALFQATMQPSVADRNALLLIFVLMAVATGLAAWWLPRRTAKFSSLRVTVIVVALAAAIVVGVASAGAAWWMFLSPHDLSLLFVVLSFGVGLGLMLAVAVAGPISRDLNAIRETAARVGEGDLSARTDISRPDELGAAAAAFDRMVERLAQTEQQRLRDERSRQAFLAAIGHDLRTPLAALQATVEALEDGVAPEPERYIRSMRHDLSALSALVDDLFLLSRIEAGNLDFDRIPIDLAEIADESIEALDPVARRQGIGLRLHTAGSVETVGGPEVLGRVIRNLVDNAIRHAPPESEVVVTVNGDTEAVLRVEDDGPGFSSDFLDAAFGSFVRADPARARNTGGAGLGLAIAKGVVLAHGGRIWAEQGPGGKVAFSLPRPDTDAGRVRAPV